MKITIVEGTPEECAEYVKRLGTPEVEEKSHPLGTHGKRTKRKAAARDPHPLDMFPPGIHFAPFNAPVPQVHDPIVMDPTTAGGRPWLYKTQIVFEDGGTHTRIFGNEAINEYSCYTTAMGGSPNTGDAR